MPNRLLLLVPLLLAACTVGPRYEEAPDTATPVAFRPGDGRGDGRTRGFGTLAGIRQRRARQADHARAGCQHDHRAGFGPAGRDPGAVRPVRLFLVPDGHGGRRPAEGAVQLRRPARSRRHPHRHLARGIRCAVGNRPVRLAAERVSRDRPPHRGGRSRPRRRAALDRRGDGASLVLHDRRARAPRAAARAAREPGGQHQDPHGARECRKFERPRPRAGRGAAARRRGVASARRGRPGARRAAARRPDRVADRDAACEHRRPRPRFPRCRNSWRQVRQRSG